MKSSQAIILGAVCEVWCMRCVQAALVVADSKMSLQITGTGDVLEPHDGVIGGRLKQICA